MLDFKQHIKEEKNTHMTHIEDMVFDGGVKGTRNAINALRALRDTLAGKASRHTDVTVKWDGAPAVFAGTDPSDGKFFVAKKGIFNKNPKVYKTPKDITDDISNPDLAMKMTIALRELPKLGIKGVIQGDIMFTQDAGSRDLYKETIDDVDYLMFHPNTIAYAVPMKSDLAKQLMKAKIGVVWHTSYSGDSFETMKASYGVSVDKFKKVPSVWAHSANLHMVDVMMTSAETDKVTKALSNAGKIFNKTKSNILADVSQDKQLNGLINIFYNQQVRSGAIPDSKKLVGMFEKFISDRFEKDIAKLKSDRGREKKAAARDEVLSFFKRHKKTDLTYLFELHKSIQIAKLILINKLSKLGKMNTFVRTQNGYKVTGDEGFVAIDKLGGNAVKLVDRLEFSANNFSPDIIKGWESNSRR